MAAVVAGHEGRHDAEHGVTEAADIQDVAAVRRLNRAVRLEVDRDRLRACKRSNAVLPDGDRSRIAMDGILAVGSLKGTNAHRERAA
jgi:hypothetical protein